MAKRFTDTGKWERPNFRKLSVASKLFWFYILDKCDNAGIWIVDMEAAEFFIGTKLNKDKIVGELNGNIVSIDNGKRWFVIDFIKFQYGETLNENNNAHLSVIKALNTYCIDYKNIKALKQAPEQPLTSPSAGALDMGKDKDKDKEEEEAVKNPDGWNEKWEALWVEWAEYKKVQHKFVYKNIYGTKKALMAKANNNLSEAAKMINNAIMSGWTGIYELDKKETPQQGSNIISFDEQYRLGMV